MPTIQFEAVTRDGIIKIPDQYISDVPAVVHVTLADTSEAKPKYRPKTKRYPQSVNEFSGVKFDTKNWKFDREEANERR